ncbi:MAG: hypothetical protein ACP5VR_04505 [Acidimicrobiales bacterium]
MVSPWWVIALPIVPAVGRAGVTAGTTTWPQLAVKLLFLLASSEQLLPWLAKRARARVLMGALAQARSGKSAVTRSVLGRRAAGVPEDDRAPQARAKWSQASARAKSS